MDNPLDDLAGIASALNNYANIIRAQGHEDAAQAFILLNQQRLAKIEAVLKAADGGKKPS